MASTGIRTVATTEPSQDSRPARSFSSAMGLLHDRVTRWVTRPDSGVSLEVGFMPQPCTWVGRPKVSMTLGVLRATVELAIRRVIIPASDDGYFDDLPV